MDSGSNKKVGVGLDFTTKRIRFFPNPADLQFQQWMSTKKRRESIAALKVV